MHRERITVLAVDDEWRQIDAFKAVLDDRYILLTAFDGGEALKILSKNQVDLIFLDINMPGMDGFETLRQIKRGPSSARVIMVSGKNSTKMIVDAMRSGAFYYLEKPVDPEDIYFTISLALEDKIEGLTETELGVFKLIGRGYCNKEIAEALQIRSYRTVETHKQNIKDKLGLTTMTALQYHSTMYYHFGHFHLTVDKERCIE